MDPLKVFIIYSHEDAQSRDDLVKFLHHLENKRKINIWTDKEILPGELWDSSIKLNLDEADIILPLVSVDFYNSNYIRDVEFKTAKERRDKGEALLVPILVKQCPWKSYEIISDLQVLPSNAKPIDQWDSQNNAYTQIAEMLEEMADKLRISRVEIERDLMQKKQLESEAKLKLETKKTEEAKKAREEALKLHQKSQAMVVVETKAKEKAQAEIKTERAERIKLKEAILVIEKQKNSRRYFMVGIATLFVVSTYFAFSNYTNLKKQSVEYEIMTAEVGLAKALQQSKVDSIRNVALALKASKNTNRALIVAIYKKALEMYNEDARSYRDSKRHMVRAKDFLKAMGNYECKDDSNYLEDIIRNPEKVEKTNL